MIPPRSSVAVSGDRGFGHTGRGVEQATAIAMPLFVPTPPTQSVLSRLNWALPPSGGRGQCCEHDCDPRGARFRRACARSSRRSATEIPLAPHRSDLGKPRRRRSSRRRNASRGATSPTSTIPRRSSPREGPGEVPPHGYELREEEWPQRTQKPQRGEGSSHLRSLRPLPFGHAVLN